MLYEGSGQNELMVISLSICYFFYLGQLTACTINSVWTRQGVKVVVKPLLSACFLVNL